MYTFIGRMLSHPSMSEELNAERHRMIKEWFERGIPFNLFLGLRVDALARGRAVLRIPWRHELIGDVLRPAIHGGVISMLADTAGGAACFTMLDRESDRVSTVDLRVDYLQPGLAADLVCEAEVVRMGNRVGVMRAQVYSKALPDPDPGSDERPIATAQGVYNIVRRD
jgi:uncharacterized protein (TIGR00369 family)